MIKFEPIEGNGWYVFDRRVPPPPAFFVETSSSAREGYVEGVVNDPSCEFHGYHFRAAQRFVEYDNFLTIRFYQGKLPDDTSAEAEISGYIEVGSS